MVFLELSLNKLSKRVEKIKMMTTFDLEKLDELIFLSKS
jgi:hypothetical protein